MTIDEESSETILHLLLFALGMSRKIEHLREWFAKNAGMISLLHDEHKELLRAEYRARQETLKGMH